MTKEEVLTENYSSVVRRILLLVGIVMMSAWGFAADAHASKLLTFTVKNEPLPNVLKNIERNSDYNVIFSYDDLRDYRVTATVRKKTAPKAVAIVLAGHQLGYNVQGKFIRVFRKEAFDAAITGRVADENGEPVIGAVVRYKNNRVIKTVTDANGNFAIPAIKGSEAELVFSYIGMETGTATFSEGKENYMRMKWNTNNIDEVVVNGYQKMDKRLMSSSVTTVKAEDIKIPNVNTIDKMLQGAVPGLMLVNTSGSVNATPKIRMRGNSTIFGNASPLWVVDGIIHEDPVNFSNDELNNIISGTGMTDQMNLDAQRSLIGSAISGVNPNDIESITFLKDASATAIYGTRAANGVIVVTTKRGQEGKPSVNFSTSLGFTGRPSYGQYNLMNSKERVSVSKDVSEYGYLYSSMPYRTGYEGALMNLYEGKISLDEFNQQVAHYETVNTDWFKLLCQNAFNQDYSVSLSGGSEVVNYYTSIGYNSSKGTTKGDSSTRYTLMSNIDARLSDKLRISTRLSFAENSNDGFYTTNPYSYALSTSRALDPDTYYTTNLSTFPGLGQNYQLSYNIFNELQHTGAEAKVRNFSGNLNVIYDILKNLKFDTTFGVNYSNTTNYQWADERSYYIAQIRGYDYGAVAPNSDAEKQSRLPHGGILNYSSMNNVSYTARAQLSYNLMLGNERQHIINAMAGFEARSNQYDGLTDVEWGYFPERGMGISYEYDTSTSGNSAVNGMNSSLDKHTVSRSKTKNNTISEYLTLVYAYKNRYVLNFNTRMDASNRFGQYTNHKWSPVWSISGRWSVSDESFMQPIKWIDNMSIRASYGEQGNVPTSVSPYLVAKYMSALVNRYSGEYQLGISHYPYPDLKWEKTATTNLGFDFSVLNGRISGSLDYYIRRGKDIIFNLPVSTEYGVTTTYRNGASLKNTGIELSLSFKPIQTKDWTWTLTPIWSKNTNNISKTSVQNYKVDDYLAGNVYLDGKPVNAVYAWEFTGLDPKTGFATFKGCSSNEDEVEKSDDPASYLKYVGPADPRFNGGLSSSLRWKNLTLSAQFAFGFGNYKRLNFIFEGDNKMPSPQTNMTKEMLGRWKQEGDQSNIPGLNFSDSSNYMIYTPDRSASWKNTYTMYNYSDARIVKGDFFRCRNLMLSYAVPYQFLRHMGITAVSLGFNVTNPFTLCSSRFNGQDPEVSNTGSVALPITQSYSLSLNVSF